MSLLIEGAIGEGGRIVEDRFVTIVDEDSLAAVADDQPIIVSRAVFGLQRAALLAGSTPLGILLFGTDDPADIADDLSRFAVVAIDFPKFTDGRGYSIARLLRERHGYRGSIRAVGDVLRDQMFYMLRCGFDAFALRHEALIEDALNAYRDFSDGYQTSVDRPVPWFKRRGTVGVAAPAAEAR